jgi:hypothetical protein
MGMASRLPIFSGSATRGAGEESVYAAFIAGVDAALGPSV